MKKAILIVLLLLLVAAGVLLVRTRGAGRAPKFKTTYQAVLLDTGQVYYGKVAGLGTAFPVLTDVYYVKSGVNPQTKQVTNVLVRRGQEWHGPDRTVLNARHIVLVEPVSPASQVAQLIADDKKQHPAK